MTTKSKHHTGTPDQETSPRQFWGVVVPFLIYGVALIIGLSVFVATPNRNVSNVYMTAAQRWIAAEPLYLESSESGHGFLYLPQAAVLHIPYVLLSRATGADMTGEIIWRIASWIIFVFAIWRLGQVASQQIDLTQWRLAITASILGLSCLRIGQSTVLMGGLIILSVLAWHDRRFRSAAIFAVLAIAVKPLAIVPALLLFAVSPQMRVRLAVGMLCLIASPFLLQSPDYVLAQYRDCVGMLDTAAELGNRTQWAQLFGLLNFAGVSIESRWQNLIRAAAAVVVLGLTYWSVTKHPRRRAAIWTLTWTFVYLMLFNPRTENSTYCLMGPVFGVFIGTLIQRNLFDPKAILLFVGVILTAGSFEIGKQFTPAGQQAIWLAPLCCCVMTGYLAIQFCNEQRQTANAELTD